MIDLHSHVLPYVDDGAKDESMSIEMLLSAKAQGVDVVAATPHFIPKSKDYVDTFLEKRNSGYAKLEAAMSERNDLPKIVLGAEVNLCKDISDFPNLQSLCYENTNYILLELSDNGNASEVAEWIYNITIKGLRPVIAHVDRYPDYRDVMDELSHLDVVYQVNAARFLTMSDRGLLKKIFRNHNKFVVSTDMHNITTRVCNMEQAQKIALKKFPAMTKMLFGGGAEAILGNSSFPAFD